MKMNSRIFFDVSYTRTQTSSTGITRTVRRLLDEFKVLYAEQEQGFEAVIFHSNGFRRADAVVAQAGISVVEPGGLFRWVSSVFARRLVTWLLHLPWLFLNCAWGIFSTGLFNQLSRKAKPVLFKPGDWLLLCDASWNYRVWIAASLAKRQGARVVTLVYDLIPIEHPQYCFPLAPPVFCQWLEHMLKLSDAIVCISDAVQQDLLIWSKKKLITLPPTGHFRLGSDYLITTAHKNTSILVEEFFADELPCFVAIGTFEPRKNYELLLEVFDRLWLRRIAVRLFIAGRTNSESLAFIQQVRSHPQQGGNLLVLFDASDADIDYAYRSARALLFPSLAEGFGLPLVEARARGCAVIASDLAAFRELADAGVTLFPPGDADRLEQLVLEHIAFDHRIRAKPMMPFNWLDSARQLHGVVGRLLSKD